MGIIFSLSRLVFRCLPLLFLWVSLRLPFDICMPCFDWLFSSVILQWLFSLIFEYVLVLCTCVTVISCLLWIWFMIFLLLAILWSEFSTYWIIELLFIFIFMLFYANATAWYFTLLGIILIGQSNHCLPFMLWLSSSTQCVCVCFSEILPYDLFGVLVDLTLLLIFVGSCPTRLICAFWFNPAIINKHCCKFNLYFINYN